MKIDIIEFLYKPETKFEKCDIFGETYITRIISPNIYVVKSDSIIKTDSDGYTKSINFIFNEVEFTLLDVKIFWKDGLLFLECKKWVEEYLG